MSPLLDARRGPLLLRTDFSDDQQWQQLLTDAARPRGPDGYTTYFVPISDRAFEGLRGDEVASLPGDASVVYAADGESMTGSERTILVIDRLHDRGRSFRVTVEEVWLVECNLSLANLDFFEFADAADEDGVFRGFAR